MSILALCWTLSPRVVLVHMESLLIDITQAHLTEALKTSDPNLYCCVSVLRCLLAFVYPIWLFYLIKHFDGKDFVVVVIQNKIWAAGS